MHLPTLTHPCTPVTRSKPTRSPEAPRRHRSPLAVLVAFPRVQLQMLPYSKGASKRIRRRSEMESVKDGETASPGSTHLHQPPHPSVLLAPFCRTLRYSVLFSTADCACFLLPLWKVSLWGERRKGKKRKKKKGAE